MYVIYSPSVIAELRRAGNPTGTKLEILSSTVVAIADLDKDADRFAEVSSWLELTCDW